MNGSGKQSFYEIQLNNGSLIAAFLIAVGLGVAVFMLGVMVGRGQAAARADGGGWVEKSLTEPTTEATGDDSIDPDFFEKVQEPEDDGIAPATVAEESGDAAASTAAATPPPAQTRAPAPGLPAADPSLPPGTGWVVQVKATPERSEAAELQAALAAAGFAAFIEEGDSNGATVYRVRVGRYEDEADARRVESALANRSDVSDTWVTRG